MSSKVVGILGGMGPEATADLFSKIIASTPAARDQEHLRILVDCIPQVPDRTEAIRGLGESPAPVLRAAARRLETWGAELIAIPCNTAHYYHREISAAVGVPVLHIMRETAASIRRGHPAATTAGVLATTGTLETALYAQALAGAGLTELAPPPEIQGQVMEAIYAIKAGDRQPARVLLMRAAAALAEAGAEVVIAGCTEVPLALRPGDLDVPLIDATLVLARAVVRRACGKEPEGP